MTRTQKHHRCLAGTSFTKACANYGCALMRPVGISHWKQQQQQQTGAGFPA